MEELDGRTDCFPHGIFKVFDALFRHLKGLAPCGLDHTVVGGCSRNVVGMKLCMDGGGARMFGLDSFLFAETVTVMCLVGVAVGC